ncbi:hypothetical protein T4E_2578 [Trichinella pseudospiralis]|uniref:Uncharacterized protein n=1 Tax=Trichinella pseudospiralis TaxID=6337 RepID=A0A0V0XS65_TRIPS|nr:hypothetical protein T4E_2578 [Trichinella pseudospiralis]KRX90752.1 hypothetical protein T4E_2578 [Trichinella pseudospiralis]
MTQQRCIDSGPTTVVTAMRFRSPTVIDEHLENGPE